MCGHQIKKQGINSDLNQGGGSVDGDKMIYLRYTQDKNKHDLVIGCLMGRKVKEMSVIGYCCEQIEK